MWSGGATPSKSNPTFWSDGTVPWLSPKDMGSPVLAGTQDRLHASAVSGTNLKLITGPSVALVVRSGILERRVPVALVPFDTTLNQDMKAVEPFDGIDAQWLAFALQALEPVILRDCRKAGTTVASLEFDRLLALPIAVPPTNEQRRIVEALEERLSQLDQALGDTAKLSDKLQALRDAVLSRFLPSAEEPTLTVGELAYVGSGATPAKSDRSYYDGGTIPWVTSADLNAGVVAKARQYITEKALKKTAVKLWPIGTLLVAMYGEGQTRGRCARLDIPATTNQACAAIVITPGSPVLPEFLHLFFDASYMRMRRLAAGGVQPNLSLGLVRSIPVPVRGRGEQTCLVSDTRRTLDALEPVRHALQALARRQHGLRRALLAAAYGGRLSVQQLSDEPADLLLKRAAVQLTEQQVSRIRRRSRRPRMSLSSRSPVEESE